MNTMNRKVYIAPDTAEYFIGTQQILMGSTLNPEADTQEITPTNEEYSGEFQGRRNNLWEDEEEDF